MLVCVICRHVLAVFGEVYLLHTKVVEFVLQIVPKNRIRVDSFMRGVELNIARLIDWMILNWGLVFGGVLLTIMIRNDI